MNRQIITNALNELGNRILSIPPEQMDELVARARNENTWFTRENIAKALRGATNYLNGEKLVQWTSAYPFTDSPKKIGLVLAGNIPLVGLHDLISVLVSGHFAVVKPSSRDLALLKFLLETLQAISPEVACRITLTDQLKNIDAVIATGSDNSARYFHQYFSKYPHIIRKNRSSLGILTGNESSADLRALGQDIFTYYGLGCRNVSKLFVPVNYSFNQFFESIQPYQHVMENHKYHNNYDYNKSVLLVNNEPHLDNGFLLLQRSAKMVSPISVLFFEEYDSENALKDALSRDNDKIQCIVSNGGWYPGSVAPGQTQLPELWDYADNVDTMKFLTGL